MDANGLGVGIVLFDGTVCACSSRESAHRAARRWARMDGQCDIALVREVDGRMCDDGFVAAYEVVRLDVRYAIAGDTVHMERY